jgi:hypothetical protein
MKPLTTSLSEQAELKQNKILIQIESAVFQCWKGLRRMMYNDNGCDSKPSYNHLGAT